MKNYVLTVCLAVAASVGFTQSSFAQTGDLAEFIADFHTELEVRPDGTIHVVETIRYDFRNQDRRGIVRDIPLTDAVGTFDRMSISNIKVTNERGAPYEFSVTGTETQLFDKIFDSLTLDRDIVTIKIGNPGLAVWGERTYVVSYDVKDALGYFDDRTELYWNATGHGWLVPIKNASVEVSIPQNQVANLMPASFCGKVGTTTSCGAPDISYDEVSDMTNVSFSAPTELLSGEGVTLAVGFAKNIVAAPSGIDLLLHYLSLWWGIFLALVVVYFWFRKSLRNWLNRRRFYTNNPVVAEFDADGLDPFQVAGIVQGSIKNKDISAQIIYLAIQGYITISKTDKVYTFLSTDKPLDTLSEYNRLLIETIKDEDTKSLRLKFYRYRDVIMKAVRTSLFESGYITSKRSTDPAATFFWGLFLAVNPGLFIWILLGIQAGVAFSGSCLLIALLSLVFRPRAFALMPDAAPLEQRLKGLRLYIDVAEDERIKFHNAPEKTTALFEALLPYAMVFGLEEKWSKEFADLYQGQPTWYADTNTGSFPGISLTDSMSHLSGIASFASLLNRPSGSSFGSFGSRSGSSSGFSGGGGGGGGGRSW
jgi:uncharacterized membrane protein YgcG